MTTGKAARMASGLTVKEDRFCQEFVISGEKSDAYRKAYSVDPAKDGDWVESSSWKLFQKKHIQNRIEELRAKTETISLYTADQAMREARRAFDLAEKAISPAAMVSAVTLRAKLAGHLVDKKEVAHKTLKDASQEELMELLRDSAKQAGLVIEKAKA